MGSSQRTSKGVQIVYPREELGPHSLPGYFFSGGHMHIATRVGTRVRVPFLLTKEHNPDASALLGELARCLYSQSP